MAKATRGLCHERGLVGRQNAMIDLNGTEALGLIVLVVAIVIVFLASRRGQ